MQTVSLKQAAVELKGSTFTLPVVYIHSEDLDAVQSALQQKIKLTPKLLDGAPIVINVAQLTSLTILPELCNILKQSGLHFVGVSGVNSSDALQQLKMLNLPLINEGKKSVKQPDYNYIEPLYIESPVRSGQQIVAEHRDLVITQLVSAGAEVIADGNIFIYGELRGKALAGASGNQKARIYCNSFEAELVSIAGQYCLSDNIPQQYQGKCVRILLNEQGLNVYELNHKGMR